jgi:hypothetical protein
LAHLNEVHVLELDVVLHLQLRVELDEEENILEMFHEFLVVNLLIAIDVCHSHDCDDFAVAKFDWLELFEAVLEFKWLQEAFIVLVKVTEYLKQGEVFIYWHLNVDIWLEDAELDEL